MQGIERIVFALLIAAIAAALTLTLVMLASMGAAEAEVFRGASLVLGRMGGARA